MLVESTIKNYQLSSDIVVIREPNRLCDYEHGYLRGWGLTGQTAGSKNLSMAHGIIPLGMSAKPHYHPFETAIYMLKGNCRVFLKEDKSEYKDIEASDFLYIPANVVHCPANIGETVVEYIVARSSSEELCLYP